MSVCLIYCIQGHKAQLKPSSNAVFTCICLHARVMSVTNLPDCLLRLSNQILLVKIFSNTPKTKHTAASSWRMWEMSRVQNAVGWAQSNWVGCQSRQGRHLVENRLDAKLWPLQVGTVLCLLGVLCAWIFQPLRERRPVCVGSRTYFPRDSPIALQYLSAFGQFLDS